MGSRLTFVGLWLGITVTMGLTSSSSPAQERDLPPDPPPGPAPAPPRLDYDSEPPYDVYERDWRYRMRNYRARRFSRDYGPPYDPYAVPYWDGPRYRYYPDRYAFDDGYRQGRRDGQEFTEWQFRYQMGTTSYLQAMENGVKAFRAGNYSLAARQFMLAASLNQGDAACRLHAVHALVALGRYDEAALTTRRAFQLQPKISFLPLDIRGQYGNESDFVAHYQKLKETAERTAGDGNLWFLLGFYQFFSDRGVEALRSLQKADTLQPGDRTTQQLLDTVRLSTPAEPAAPQSQPASESKATGRAV